MIVEFSHLHSRREWFQFMIFAWPRMLTWCPLISSFSLM